MRYPVSVAGGLLVLFSTIALSAEPATRPTTPRVESVVMSHPQPQENAKTTIWYDDFDGPVKAYTEGGTDSDPSQGFGGTGASMLCLYEQGQRGKGNRKVFFGDSPTGKVVRRGETFDEIYWRIYVKHQDGFLAGLATPEVGGPDKMSRATSIVSSKDWKQAMIAHVWSTRDTLTLDPASGVRNGQVITTKYNDFDNLRWLGMKPFAGFPIHSASESGWWVCVESRAKLNTPGKKDGINQLWIDGRLEAERTGLDWRGTYQKHGINGVFLEAYWNKGSPVTQKRWYDNFVISTEPIGPAVCPRNPTILKTPFRGTGTLQEWQLEIASDREGTNIVWRSHPVTKDERVSVDASTGKFEGALAGQNRLAGNTVYYCRVRERGDAWSEWSPWHQAFKTGP